MLKSYLLQRHNRLQFIALFFVLNLACCSKHLKDSSKHKIHFEDNCMKGTRKAETFHINYIALAQVKVQNAINATIDVNIDKTVKFGTSVEITVSKSIHNFNIVFFDYQLNLCDLWTDLMHGNSQCPIKPGHYNLLYRSDALPVLITEGVYHMKLLFTNEIGEGIGCVAFNMTVI